MRVSMPTGPSHGWGVAGESLSREIAALPPLEGVTLHCIRGHDFQPYEPAHWDTVNIGYCFFEYPLIARNLIRRASERWDWIVAGSGWCEEQLRLTGVRSTCTILQGIDHHRFPPASPRPADGRFIVFSGGKFEFRKGQDLVIAAMRRFMEHHSDVWLSCAWHNHWPHSLRTMEESDLISFRYRDAACGELIRQTLAENGIPLERVILVPPLENHLMRGVYALSDIGLFPNRCEGGNNMVMCEYMAVGRPVIASNQTGHGDVITRANSFPLSRYVPRPVFIGPRVAAIWPEPDPDEILELLEEAYARRSILPDAGFSAARSMMQLDWGDAARRFHDLALDILAAHRPVEEIMHRVSRLLDDGNKARAERILEAALRLNPSDHRVLNALATIDDAAGLHMRAIHRYDLALLYASPPESLEIRINRAHTRARGGDSAGAVTELSRIVSEFPDSLRGWRSLAFLHQESGNREGRFLCLRKIIDLGDATPLEIHDFVESLQERRQFGEARTLLEKGIERFGGVPLLLNDLGMILHELGEFTAARRALLAAHLASPHDPAPCNNLGNLSKTTGQYDDALGWYEKALARDPGNPTVRFNRSLIHLLHGRFEEGWNEYECRFHKTPPVILPHPEIQRWDGGSLEGKRILVQSEQVYGDTFMFCRFVPILRQLGGSVVFQCQDGIIRPSLQTLERHGIRIVVRGEPLPPVDLQVPLLSLPKLLGTTIDSIPYPDGYLSPPDEAVRRWEELIPDTGSVRVALVWGGRKAPLNADRSIPLSRLSPLLTAGNMEWYSFQLGDDREQLPPFGHIIRDLAQWLTDFGETAAALARMDLLITIDTAIAHLAGALGVTTWLLLKHDADWRWFLDRPDSPWYSSHRLWRQKTPGDWDRVILAVRSELVNFLSSFPSG